MSVSALNLSISTAAADGHITAEEANTLTSPQVLGAYTDKDEFQALTNLAGDIKRPNAIDIKPLKKQSLTKRGVNIGGIVGGTIGVVGAVGAITLTVGAAIALDVASLLFVLPALGGVLVGLLAFVGAVIGIAALGGYIHSKVKGSSEESSGGPVTADPQAADQIEKTLNKGVTAKSSVKKGTKIGGIVGGVLGGLGLGGWTLGTLIGAGAVGGSGLMVGYIVFFPLALGVLAVAGLSVGIGALAGFIHSKVKTKED